MYKSIKKVALIIAVVFVSVNMTAQNESGFMVNVGYISNSSSVIQPTMLGKIKVSIPLDGFLVGAGYDLMFTENLGLKAGLEYSLTSNKMLELSAHTLYLPIRFMYRYSITDNVALFAYAGPKISFDVAGSTDYKKFNLLIGPGIGAMYKNFGLQLGYDLGLIDRFSTPQTNGIGKDNPFDGDIIKPVETKGSVKTNNFYLSLIYKF